MTDRASTLQPTRPLVWIGVETTGTGPAMSRIAKIAILRIEPTGVTTNYIRRLNPGKVAGLRHHRACADTGVAARSAPRLPMSRVAFTDCSGAVI